MTEHYFSPNPTSAHDRQVMTVHLRGRTFVFTTDAGVFSKEKIDKGTALLIKAMEIKDGQRVLDLGCGYGPIGLVAAALNPSGTVDLVDINPRAVELAKENAARNGLANVRIFAGEGFLPIAGEMYDVILTNPPIRAGKEVIYGLVEEAKNHLRPGGKILAVIRTKQGAKSLEKFLEQVYGNVTEVEKGGGFRVIQSVKED